MERFDAVIIGAGLAGLQCARLLGRRGHSVLLVDRKRRVDQFVHTTGIFVRKTFEDFPFGEAFLGPAIRDVSLYSPAGRQVDLRSGRDEFRVGDMRRIYAHFLDEAIRVGVVWLPETSNRSSTVAGEMNEITLLTKGVLKTITARFLIGGDGAKSRVARDLGLGQNREWIAAAEEVLSLPSSDGPPRFHCFVDPQIAPGYLAWYVDDGREVHLGVGGYPDRFNAAHALRQFRSRIESMFDLQGARLLEKRGGMIPVGGVLSRIGCRRGLLIGDAAGAVSPLTAGGLDPAMRLSHFAAEVVGDALSTGDSSLLERYSGSAFRTRFVSRLWMRSLFAHVRSPRVVEAAFAVMAFAPVRLLAHHVFFGRSSFPDIAGLTTGRETLRT